MESLKNGKCVLEMSLNFFFQKRVRTLYILIILNRRFYSSLGIFKQTMIHKKLGMDKDYLATKAIPFLFPLAVEPGLNLSQVICVTRPNNSDVLLTK